jgi:hypothetical protein
MIKIPGALASAIMLGVIGVRHISDTSMMDERTIH